MRSSCFLSLVRSCAAMLLFQLAALRADSALVNRWSFNNAAGAAAAGTPIVDSVGGANGAVVGIGGTFTGAGLTLPGSTTGAQTPAAISAYVDLPNGLISTKTNLTLEIWARQEAARNWQRIVDFGRTNVTGNAAVQGAGAATGEILPTATTAPSGTSSSDNLMLALNRGTTANTQRLVGRLNGASELGVNTDLTLATATQHHFVLTFADGVGAFGASGGQVKWYFNGALAATLDVSFRLLNVEDVNNWLGRSQYSGDSNANITYDEVRLYNHAFTDVEVAASRAAGANPVAPVAQPDAITMHHGQKAGIAVLANDAAAVTAVVVQAPQFGTAVPDAYGRIRYTHTTGTPAGDTFTYRAVNIAGQSAETTVTVTFSSNLRLANNAVNVPATPPPTSYQLVDAWNIAFSDPVCLATPPGETLRLFVCQKGGLLRVVQNVTATTPTVTTFLDVAALLTSRGEAISTNSEQGLLGLAFHPNYATNRQFFVFYSVDKDAATAGSPIFERVSRFTTQAGNPNAADAASEVILIEQEDQAGNHNGGDLHFGPVDKYLYVSLGDEGDQDDTRQNSQRITKDFFAGILRIDVDKKPGNLEPNAHPNPAQSAPVNPNNPATNAVKRYETSPGSGVFLAAYSIPVDNPFVAIAQGGTWNGTFNGIAVPAAERPYVRSEFWAVGFRNPWRMSFDPPDGNPASTELWVGDVGGGVREEIDIAVKGGNYGWNYREGFIQRPGSGTPPAGFVGINPIHDYKHTGDVTEPDPNKKGNSITGGFVYRGTRFSNLVGAYLFADYSSGNLWTLRRSPLTVERIAGEGGLVCFGRDPSNGDVLIGNINSDRIRRLVGGDPAGGFPATLGATGLFADLSDLSPNPGLLPYSINLPFWSDFARKSRWFIIPDTINDMTWSRDGLWTFPAGQIWVKHFDLPLTRSNPPLPSDPPTPAKRLETRLIVKNATGAYGVSYRWNDAGTEATLVPDEGVGFDVTITENGTPRVQRWTIPSRAQCTICHTPQAGHALSFDTRQMNRSETIHGHTGNEIELLRQAGYFSNVPESPNGLPRHLAPNETAFPIEARVRSYLAVNCAYCHKAGGTALPAAWDGRPELTLTQTGLVNGNAANNGGDPLNKLIVPGDTLHSIVLNRMAVTNGFTRMPPIATSELDVANIALLTDWITQSLPNRQTYDQWRAAQPIDPGAANQNADNDGANNESEFLAGTDPHSGFSFLSPQLAPLGPNISLSFSIPANRSFQILTSTDMFNWSLWDVAGNHGIAQPGGSVIISGPWLGSQQFFRLNLREN